MTQIGVNRGGKRCRKLALLTAFALAASAAPAAALRPVDEVRDGVFAVTEDSPQALSATISSDLHPDDSADAVVVTTGLKFPDLLAGGSLVGLLDAPLLLTTGDAASYDYLEGSVRSELERVANGATTVFILGGTAAVSTRLEEEIRQIPGVARSQRLAGPDRIDTAIAIANYVVDRSPSKKVIVARGFGGTAPYADALAGGAYAAATASPILLTETNRLSPATKAWVQGRQPGRSFHILGGTAAVATQAENELRAITPDVSRWAGVSRYETAIAVAKASALWNRPDPCDGTVDQFTVANGNAFQAATLAAAYEVPVLLSNGPNTDSARAYLDDATDCQPVIAVLGGGDINAVGTADALGAALGRGTPVGSRSNPFPLQQTAATDDGWDLSVVEVDLDADAEMAAESSVNDPPDSGNQYVLVRVRARRTASDEGYLNPLGFYVIGTSNTAYGAGSGNCFITPDALPSDNVQPGGTTEGNLCFEVSESEISSIVLYRDYFTDYIPYFKLR